MPYTRKGKCVYRKDTNKKVGCSKSTTKAKQYIKALYANVEDEESISFNEVVNLFLEKYSPKKKKSKLRSKCQSKSRAKYDVWPSAYASGYVQKCVKRGGKIK